MSLTKMSGVVTKEGFGRVDLNLRYNAEDAEESFVSFKLKKQNGKKSVRENYGETPESLKKIIIPFSILNRVHSEGKQSFHLETTSKETHTFKAGNKNKCKKWVAKLSTCLNDYKLNNLGKMRKVEYSNTLTFRESASLSKVGNVRNQPKNTKGSEHFDMFRSPKIKLKSKTAGTGVSQFNLLNSKSSGKETPKKPSMFPAPPAPPKIKHTNINDTLKRRSRPDLTDFYFDSRSNDFGTLGRPAPPSLAPPHSTRVFTTYVKHQTEMTQSSRKVVIPVLVDDNDAIRDRSKTEKELNFLRHVVKTSRTLRTIVGHDFDDKAREDMIEKMFKLNTSIDESVVEVGDKKGFLYILQSGVFVQSIPGSEEPIKRAAAGSTYGELQLKYGSSSLFKVICKKPCLFWVLARKDYKEIVEWNAKRKFNRKVEMLRSVDCFKKVLSQQDFFRLAQTLDIHFATKDETLVRLGSAVTSVYFIAQGEAHFYAKHDVNPRAKMVKGENFGLLALFEEVKSKYELVIGAAKTVYFSLKVEDFEVIFGNMKHLMEEIVRKQKNTSVVRKGHMLTGKEVESIRATHAQLEKLPVQNIVDQFYNPPTIKSIAITESEYSDTEDDSSYSEIEEEEHLEFLESPALLAGMEFQNIEVLNLINSGSFGHVYTARYRDFHNPKAKALKVNGSTVPSEYAFPKYAPVGFALKIMLRHKITHNHWQDKVDNEMLAMAEVSYHCRTPFILQMYHSFCCPKFIHLLIELGEGGDLYGLVRGLKHQRLEERAARYYVACVVNGLDVLHQRRILYRDLKPENLILNRAGHLKVADLGLAKKTLRTATQCGTPEYTAPEVIAGTGHDHACDWWAVGILIFELHYGKTPFYARGTQNEIYKNIENHKSPMMYYDERNPKRRKENCGYLKGDNVLSQECKDLVAKLLIPKSSLRLGYMKPGPQKVRDHPYFTNHSSFSWERLAQLKETPPFIIDLAEEEKIENLEQDPGVKYPSNRRKDQSDWKPKVNTSLAHTPSLT